MPVPKETISAQLQQLLPRFNVRRCKAELDLLHTVIQPGETIYALTSGLYQPHGSIPSTQLVVATNWRVFFLDKKLLGGVNQIDLPLDRIQGVMSSVGWLQGEITVTTGGAAWQIKQTEKESTKLFADTLNWLVQQVQQRTGHAQSAPSATAPPKGDVLSQLERLAQLRHAGVLTDQEFAAQKARILGSA